MTEQLQRKLNQLRAIFVPMRSVMVAFSGGVDSTFVLKVAHDTIGERVIALTTTSPTMPDEDRDTAIRMAAEIGARHLVIDSNELEIPGYAANPINRCYLCKTNLFEICEARVLAKPKEKPRKAVRLARYRPVDSFVSKKDRALNTMIQARR